jgi:hypothetical protein
MRHQQFGNLLTIKFIILKHVESIHDGLLQALIAEKAGGHGQHGAAAAALVKLRARTLCNGKQ